MPHSSRRIQQLAKRLASQSAYNEAAQLEERLQNLSGKFRTAQLQFQAARTQYYAMQQECVWLQKVVNVKQGIIEELLPYYPHPLTPKMLYDIELY